MNDGRGLSRVRFSRWRWFLTGGDGVVYQAPSRRQSEFWAIMAPLGFGLGLWAIEQTTHDIREHCSPALHIFFLLFSSSSSSSSPPSSACTYVSPHKTVCALPLISSQPTLRFQLAISSLADFDQARPNNRLRTRHFLLPSRSYTCDFSESTRHTYHVLSHDFH